MSYNMAMVALFYVSRWTLAPHPVHPHVTLLVIDGPRGAPHGELHLLLAPQDDFKVLFAALLMISCKYHQDKHYSNAHWADLSGCALTDVNDAERALLKCMSYACCLRSERYAEFLTWARTLQVYWTTCGAALPRARALE